MDQVSLTFVSSTDKRHPIADPFVLCMKGKLHAAHDCRTRLTVSCYSTQSRNSFRKKVEE